MDSENIQKGGRVYGKGLHGRTIDVVPRVDAVGKRTKAKDAKDAKDSDTMLSGLLTASRTPAWIAYEFDASKRNKVSQKSAAAKPRHVALKKRKMTAAEMDSVMSSLANDSVFRTMVAKEMRETAPFEEELRMNDRVLRAYGEEKAVEYTTLRVVPLSGAEIVGIRVPASNLHYTLQTRCQVPLDRFKFKEVSEVREFVRDIMASFDVLHKAGYLHADVKRDNMIYCSLGDGGRKFRLIDWGACTSIQRMRKGYIGGTYVRPKNSISPIAWFVYGAEPVARWITMGRAALLHTNAFTSSPTFRQFAADAIAGSTVKIERIVEETGEEVGINSIEQPKARRLAFDRHWKSFDLFNLGFIIAEIACTTRGGRNKKEHERLMKLAYELVDT